MAVFTAVATAIVGAAFAATTIGTIVVGVIATGLAIGTSKLLGVFTPPKGAEDPGVKVQLPPATDNKIPRMYGANFTGGIITDAEIKNQNKTMTYCLVISEKGNLYGSAENWQIGSIYRGDGRLGFNVGSPIVQAIVDPNATASTSVGPGKNYPNGRMSVRVYAGGSEASNQIFPTTNKVPAYGSGVCQFLNWTSANTMQDLVFAIVEINYDPDNGFTGLDAITFEIFNPISFPPNVLADYLSNERYGMGNVMFPTSYNPSTGTSVGAWLDPESGQEWAEYCAEQVPYISTANVTLNHSRYLVDGALSTFDNIKQNVNKILQSTGAFMTYNNKTGRFAIVTMKAESNATIANAFVLSDDNLVGNFNVTSTDLFSLYNQIDVEFASVEQKDQTDTLFLEIPSGDRAPNEPDNKINVRYDMLNDRSRAYNLANIDLRQSRFATVVTCTGDYTTLPIDVGDVVKVNNATYGWTDKLFRAMRTVEREAADSMIMHDLTLLEYDPSVYTHNTTTSSVPKFAPFIANFLTSNTRFAPTLGAIQLFDDLDGPGRAYWPGNGVLIANNTVTVDQAISELGLGVSNATPFAVVPTGIPFNSTYDEIIVSMWDPGRGGNIETGNNVVQETFTPQTGLQFFPSNTTIFTNQWAAVKLSGLLDKGVGNSNVQFDVKLRNSATGITSPSANSVALPLNVRNVYTNKIFGVYGAGTQLDESGALGYDLTPGNTSQQIVDPVYWDVTRIDTGFYRLTGAATLGGVYANISGDIPYDVSFGARANVQFSNATANAYVVYDTSGIQGTGMLGPLLTIKDSNELQIDPVALSLVDPSISADMYPVNASLYADGSTTLPITSNVNPYFFNIDLSLQRITKSARE